MADYWKSQGKYWCNYCKIFVAENATSRKHHEQGLKHKNNVERFLRDVKYRSAKEKQDEEYMAREMAKINQAATRRYELDVGSGQAKGGADNTAPVHGKVAPGSSAPARATAASSSNVPVPRSKRIVIDKEQARLPAPLPEGAEIGAPGPWIPVEPPSDIPTRAGQVTNDSKSANNIQRSQPSTGSLAANEGLLGAEEDEEDETTAATDDPDDLRSFQVVERSHPDEHDSDGDKDTVDNTSMFKKRKAIGAGASAGRNIRRKNRT